MDFYRICERTTKSGKVEIYPEFLVGRSRDILIQGRDFQAIWDEEKGLWSTDEFDVATFVDRSLLEYQKNHKGQIETVVKTMSTTTLDYGPASRLGSPVYLTMGRSLTPSLYLRTVLLERKTMPPQDSRTPSRRVRRTLGELSLELYMMRMLDESSSGSSVPSWLETLSGYRNLPSCMVPRDLVSQQSSTFWNFYSRDTQLPLMRGRLDPSQTSSQPAPLVRVRPWPSIKTATSQESRPTVYSIAWSHMRRFSSMRRELSDTLNGLTHSFSSALTSLSRSLTPSQESSDD